MSNPASANPRLELRARRRSAAAPLALLTACALAAFSGCNFIFPDHELDESRRVANCRVKAKRACYKQVGNSRSVKYQDCVSERSWQCALGNDSEDRKKSKKK